MNSAAGIYGELRKKVAGYDESKVAVPVTVRTFETLIRLATAHAKLRMSKNIDQDDILIAAQLLNETIFREEVRPVKQEVKNEEMESEESDEEKIPVSKRSKRKRPDEIENDIKKELPVKEAPSKKMKLDEQSQVLNLFKAKTDVLADVHQKKLIFGIINKVKDAQNKTTIDAIWKIYLGMPERSTSRPGTTDALINDKNELVTVVEALQQDNLCIFAVEDN